MPGSTSEEDFVALVAAIRARDKALSPFAAGVVAAVSQGIATDSRTFAKLFSIAHALVLREINLLSGPDTPLEIVRREARTQRTHFKLTVKGEALMAQVLDLGQRIAK